MEKQECATISHENSLLLILPQFQIEGIKQSSSESPSDLVMFLRYSKACLLYTSYFEVNQALISRSNVFELHSLDKEDIKKLIVRAITDDEKGMGIYGATITDDALDFLSDMAEEMCIRDRYWMDICFH